MFLSSLRFTLALYSMEAKLHRTIKMKHALYFMQVIVIRLITLNLESVL